MTDKEFSLIDKPWIRVIDSACKVSEVSLKELFANAHLYKDLCGELPTQDFAVMRLLLAILHTVFSRYSASGKPSPIKDPDDALDRWEELWKAGKFPAEVISDYLETQKESFYLFHPERPFYQVERAKIGTEYTASKLNGNLSESSNKLRLFPNVSGKDKETLTYSEAARWLFHLNAFDDCSAKKSSEAKKLENVPSMTTGWLGKLGLVCAAGDNLFETLMLNLIMLNGNGEIYAVEKPIWEREKIPDGERKEIPSPDNLAELYTLQSRRIFLKRSDDCVTGYYVLGGDFFPAENAFIEPMTLWKNKDKNTNNKIPQTHDASRQFWRDFSVLVANNEDGRKPGVVAWLNELERQKILNHRPLTMKIVSVSYGGGAQKSNIENIFWDSLQMHAALISDMNPKWQTAVIDSVEFCDKISQRVWTFAKNVDLAAGGSNSTKESRGTSANFADKAKADFFNRIDAPFRKWLCALDPAVDDKDESQKAWRHECVDIARRLGEEIIAQTDSAAFFGRTDYSAAKAMNEYLKALNKAKNF